MDEFAARPARLAVDNPGDLRELPGLADIRLIAVTGYGQESDRRRTRDADLGDQLQNSRPTPM